MELTNRSFRYCLLMGGHAKPERCRLRTSRGGVAPLSFKAKLVIFARCVAAVFLNLEFWKLDIQKRGDRSSRVELGGAGQVESHAHFPSCILPGGTTRAGRP
jgi:hypothetical protein